jgi:hypothetical protein
MNDRALRHLDFAGVWQKLSAELLALLNSGNYHTRCVGNITYDRNCATLADLAGLTATK